MNEITEDPAMNWISVTDRLPEKNQRVIAWYEGYEEHSEATWHREGIDFAVYWYPGCEHSTDGWANDRIEKAKKYLGASRLEIAHWCPLPGRPQSHTERSK